MAENGLPNPGINIKNIFLEDEKIQKRIILNNNCCTFRFKFYLLYIIYIVFIVLETTSIILIDDKHLKMYILIFYPLVAYLFYSYDTRLHAGDNLFNGIINLIKPIQPLIPYNKSKKELLANLKLLEPARKQLINYGIAHGDYEDIAIKARDGYELRVVLGKLKDARKKQGLILYLHGGGMVIGPPRDTNTDMLVELSKLSQDKGSSGYLLASVDYRMAPDHPFPTPPHDCFDALQYFIKNADKYNLDVNKICITGVSAGGGLSAATAIQCMRNDIPITCTGLVIPMVAPPCTASYQFYSRLSAVLSADIMLWFWRMYCSPQDYTNPLCAPLFASDDVLKGFPETFLWTGTLDVLRDEGILFGKRIENLGTKVTRTQASGTHVGCMVDQKPLRKYFESLVACLDAVDGTRINK